MHMSCQCTCHVSQECFSKGSSQRCFQEEKQGRSCWRKPSCNSSSKKTSSDMSLLCVTLKQLQGGQVRKNGAFRHCRGLDQNTLPVLSSSTILLFAWHPWMLQPPYTASKASPVMMGGVMIMACSIN